VLKKGRVLCPIAEYQFSCAAGSESYRKVTLRVSASVHADFNQDDDNEGQRMNERMFMGAEVKIPVSS
jgi:hypothetical protein